MKKQLIIIIMIMCMVCGFFGMHTVRAEKANPKDILRPGTYYETVLEKINSASESIFLVMPDIIFFAKDRTARVTSLMQALVRAHRRGVFVFVLMNLDGSTVDKPANLDAFFFLNDNGMDVHYDELEQSLEAQFIVFDKKEAVIGSTAWKEASIVQTNQIDRLIVSESYAKELIDFVLGVKIYDNPLALDFYDQLYLSPDFVQHPNGMKAFYERSDTEALMAYLYLLRKYTREGKPTFITVNLDEFAKDLGLDKGHSVAAARSKTRGLLERLSVTYVLLAYEQISEANNFSVTFYDLSDSSQLKLPFCEGIRLSDAFFEAGWFQKLTVAEQYIYFLLLSLESKVGYGTWFKVSYDDFRMLPGIRQDYYVDAVRSLRAYNLINVTYLNEDMNTGNEEYTDFECLILTPLFQDWLDNQINDLTKLYSPRLVNQARSIAEEFYKQNDIETIEQIIHVLEKYTSLKVNEVVVKDIKTLGAENPYKTVQYLEELLDLIATADVK